MQNIKNLSVFLTYCKKAVKDGNCYFVRTPKAVNYLIELDITERNALSIIYDLTPNNYCEGPKPHHSNQSRMIWIFGYFFDDIELYIKLEPDLINHNEQIPRVKILSFHPAKHPMKYPLQKKEI